MAGLSGLNTCCPLCFNLSKILYIWKSEYPWDVRVEKVCKALLKAGHDITILARWGGSLPQESHVDGIKIIRAGYGKKRALFEPVPFNPFWKKAIRNTVNDIKPDMIIVREIMLALPAFKAASANKVPVVMDMAEHYPAAMKEWKKYRETFVRRLAVHSFNLPEMTERNCIKLMNGIITVCEEQVQRLNSEYNYPEDNMTVVHNTPEKGFFGKSEKEIPKKAICFGHHGHMTAEKSIENLIMGFLIAAEINPDIKLLLAGAGECFEDMKNIAKASQHADRIEFTGVYKIEDLPGILDRIDVGVIPYQISDFNNYTIHNKLFDYFALGKPVIVSQAKPLKRVVLETNAGIVCDCSNPDIIAETILNISNNDLKTLSENSYIAFRNKYNWDIDSQELIRFIEKYMV